MRRRVEHPIDHVDPTQVEGVFGGQERPPRP
jgi:hypothetical protein